MNKRTLFVLIPALLLSLASCGGSTDCDECPSVDDCPQCDVETIPYDKLFTSTWMMGYSVPTHEAADYDVFIDFSTSKIYYYLLSEWHYLCVAGDETNPFGATIKIVDGEVYVLKRYQIDNTFHSKWVPMEVVDLSKYKQFSQQNVGLYDHLGQKYLGYYSMEETNKTIYGQGGTIYDGKMYVGQNNGNFQIKDFETNTIIASMALDKKVEIQGTSSVKQPHNNSIGYAPREDSEFPYIYTNCYSDKNHNKGTLCVYSFDHIHEEVDEDVELTCILGASLNMSYGGSSINYNPNGSYGHVTTINSVLFTTGMTFTISADYVYMIACYSSDGTYLGSSKGGKTSGWIASDGNPLSLDFLQEKHPATHSFKVVFKDPDAPQTKNPSSKTPEEAGVVIHRKGLVDAYTNDLAQVIKIGFVEDPIWTSSGGPTNDLRPYGNFAIDYENGFLYAIAAKTKDLILRTFKFKLPAMTDGEFDETLQANVVTLGKDDIIEYFDTAYAFSIQDVDFYNGYIYITEGFTNNENEPARMRVIDVNAKAQVAQFDIYNDFFAIEPEFVCWYEGELYYSDTTLRIYKVNLI